MEEAKQEKTLQDIDLISLLQKYAEKTGQKSDFFELGLRTGKTTTGEQVFQITIRWAIADIIVATGKDYKKMLNGLWDLLDDDSQVSKLKLNIARADMAIGAGQSLGAEADKLVGTPVEGEIPVEDKKRFIKTY